MEKSGKKTFSASILNLIRSKDCLNIRNVRPPHFKYMLIFSLAPVFANMQGALFADFSRLWGLDAMTLVGSSYCVGAGLTFAFTGLKSISKISHALAIATAVFFAVWIFTPGNQLGLISAMLFGACLGGSAACAAFAYTFVLNNAERFLGAALISMFFALSQLDFSLSFISGLFPKAYLTAITAGSSVCLLLYKKNDFPTEEEKPKASFNPALKLTLYFFVAHYLVEIFYTYLPGTSTREAVLANGVMGILVVLLAITLQFTTKRGVWNMCNLFFIAITATYALYFMPESSALRSAARFIHGFEQMGYIAAYYLLGCVFKKHGDFRLFKLSLVILLPLSMIIYVIPGIISVYAPERLPLAATLTSGFIFIIFMLLSPAYSSHLFFADWSDDFTGVDMTKAMLELEKSGISESFGLSCREKEIAALLLHGETAKPISEKLNISTHTVNFHIKNLYKKLDIKNRAELFARFGSSDLSVEDISGNKQVRA